MTGVVRQGEELICDGVRLAELCERHGTPLYAYSAGAVRAAYAGYSGAFASVPHRICYALKANGTGAVLRLLRQLGAGADVVSGGELRAALRAGFAPGSIVFSGVGKTADELALGVESDIAAFNAESEDELSRIAAVARRLGRRARVALRVNPDIDARSHPYISTGKKDNKFGVDIAVAEEVLLRARDQSLAIVGVQCHIGSQITEVAPLGEAARALAALSRRLIDAGLRLQTIDLGGGLGVDYAGRPGPTPADLAAQILPALQGLPLELWLEPGRYLIARAGVLLTRVLLVKEGRGKRFVVVDAAMNDLLRPALYQAFHRIEPVARRPGAQLQVADVVGPVGETGDFMARDRELPQVAAGDLLAVLDTGAYGFAMASNYNLRPRAAEVMVDAGEAQLIRRRESFDDLVRTEV
jgi:diaminopimelate decarboxylase